LTPPVIARRATIRPTPRATPIAVVAVRAGRCRRFREINEGQVIAPNKRSAWEEAAGVWIGVGCISKVGNRVRVAIVVDPFAF
jgi:hypothetical protein